MTDHRDAAPGEGRKDFIRTIVQEDIRAGRHPAGIVTRFPPEPNGYLHIGHAKSIGLNFGIAAETGGRCHLRFDDTNPETEDQHYVDAIIEDVRWLGYDWGEHLYHAADYFPQMYALAEHLITGGLAYVDGASEDEVREARGTVTEPGRPTPARSRPAEENLDLFRRMRDGEFPDGSYVLRAKIDLASPNMLMRDPILYRIRNASHYRTGDDWCIYPMYDFAHPLEDAIERITHSLCTLEFENNRPLYDWVVERWVEFERSRGNDPARPHQYEFARGNLDYTVMSKRKLLKLVRGGHVGGWDDPRMPTIAGLRRRGVTPAAIRSFWAAAGVAKVNSRVDIGKLEYAIRDDLNQRAPRVLCVLEPLKVVITNFPEGETQSLDAPYYPHDVPGEGSRKLPFTREIYIDRADFMEDPPKGYYRLRPGGEVRLRYAYVIRCEEIVKDADGSIRELRCTYDPDTRGGANPEGRVVRGAIQWVSATHGVPCEVRLYDRLFTVPDPDTGDADFKEYLNPDSLVVVETAMIEPSVRSDPTGSRYQFERVGYFCSDRVESRADALVFNRTVTLRDTWGARAAPSTAPPERSPRKQKAAKSPEHAHDRAARSAARAGAEGTPELDALATTIAREHGIAEDDARTLTRDAATVDLFRGAVASGGPARAVANWIIHELPREIGDGDVSDLSFGGEELAALVAMAENGTLSSSAAREVLAELSANGGSPAAIVERRGLRQISDPDALGPIVEEVLDQNTAKVDAYRAGKTGLLGFFVGQVMKRTGGSANPELVQRILADRLS